jgi:diguanylate cyclase (GGDEF)-like protein
MYMTYLMCGYAATLALVLVACRIGARSVPGLRGMGLLSWALFFGFAGILLLAMRPFAPAWITIILANAAILLGSLLVYCATADSLTVPMRFLPWGIGLLVSATVANAYFTYLSPALTARILVFSGTCAVYSTASAILLFQSESSAGKLPGAAQLPHTPTTALALLRIFIAAQHVLRCVLAVCYSPGDFDHVNLIQLGFSYSNMVLNLVAGCGLIWLALCIHRRDLQAIARTDSLTGLPNRLDFEETLARELRRANYLRKPVVLLLLDIDHFKAVNDTWGHLAGDHVIQQVGGALREGLRPSDILSRIGGEEFVALLRDATAEHAEEVAERLRTEIAGLSGLPGNTQVTISVGVAQSRQDETPEALFHRCDEAMYRSKHRGRNLVTVSEILPAGIEPLAPTV